MDSRVVNALRAASEVLGLRPALLPSGAVHDAQNFALEGIPAGMVFVRSTGGSHNPFEHAMASDAALGVKILLLSMAGISDEFGPAAP